MKKNRLLIITVAILVSFLTFNIKAKALTDAEQKLCDNKNAGCYCLKTDSSVCTLQIGAPSGHNYHLVNKTNCGCSASAPQKYASFTETIAIDVCSDAGVLKAFQMIGYGITIIKIIVPLILILLGAMDFGKAVISGDEKAIKSSTSTLIKRAIIAVVVFFIPTIVYGVTNLVSQAKSDKTKFKCLAYCINKPSSCKINSDIFK